MKTMERQSQVRMLVYGLLGLLVGVVVGGLFLLRPAHFQSSPAAPVPVLGPEKPPSAVVAGRDKIPEMLRPRRPFRSPVTAGLLPPPELEPPPAEKKSSRLTPELQIKDATGPATFRTTRLQGGMLYNVTPQHAIGVTASKEFADAYDTAVWGKDAESEETAGVKYRFRF